MGNRGEQGDDGRSHGRPLRGGRRWAAAGGLVMLLGGASAPAVHAGIPDGGTPGGGGGVALPGPRHAPVVPRTDPPAAARSSPGRAVLLREAVEELRRDAPGHLAVGVLDPASGERLLAGDDRAFACASIAKVNILATLLLLAQDSGRTLTEEERRLARDMITRSDNKAADTLWRTVGGAEGMARADRRLGLRETVPDASGRWGLTRTTAADQLRLLQAVFEDDSPLDPASRAYLRTLMREVVDEQAWGVPAASDAPGAAPVKNGWMPRSATGLWVVNSIGLVERDGRELLVVVLSDDQPDVEAGIEAVEAAAETAVPR